MNVVKGSDFVQNPSKYVNVNSACTWILMGGIMTDCSQTAEEVPKTNGKKIN